MEQHIEPSNSPWNTPIFVIKKKSGKWRLLQDLRAINTTMEDIGALQPGLPSPVAVPFQYNMIRIDIQDCCFTNPLADQDYKWFAFNLPSANFKQPYKCFHGRLCLLSTFLFIVSWVCIIPSFLYLWVHACMVSRV